MMDRDRLACPQCGADCERDMIDVGVGEMPAGPWGCPECHWVQRELYDVAAMLVPPETNDD